MAERVWIAKYFAPAAVSPGAAGLLDDVAELATGSDARIVTTDALIEAVHFLRSDPPETVARKLVRVNVSDILAKGARPSEALLTLAWPQGRDEAELARFAEALTDELEHWNIQLLGGDTTSSPGGLFLSLTLTG
ncbi:MAG: thiamine-phosphate kinase, partial [Hyphomonas sp.]|nr:thiamine-phosphate kinase [Hyphomonas sp.]